MSEQETLATQERTPGVFVIQATFAPVYFAGTVNNTWREEITEAYLFTTMEDVMEAVAQLGLTVNILELEPVNVLTYTPPIYDEVA